MSKILLVEDEHNLGAVLKNYLELSGFTVQWYTEGKKAYSQIKNEPFDLCLLDVMMPEMDGFTLGKAIRNHNQDIPIIYLTARSQKDDILKGYHLGADDYITKPFDSEVLIQKIRAILRRQQKEKEQIPQHFQLGSYTFDTKFRMLNCGTFSKRLSPKESELLQLLCMHKNDILPREKALKSIWKEDSYFTTRSMDVYITKLRKYLDQDTTLELINIHSIGYLLKVP